jgi:hypothetical protein
MWAFLFFMAQVRGDEYSCSVERESFAVSLVQVGSSVHEHVAKDKPKAVSTSTSKSARAPKTKRASFPRAAPERLQKPVAKDKPTTPKMKAARTPKAKRGSFSRAAAVQSVQSISHGAPPTLPSVVGEVAKEFKARRASSSPDVSIVNKTLDTIEGLVESINSSAIAMLSDVMSASSAFSDVLTDFQSSIDDATTELEENDDSEDSDAAQSEELKSFISWATTLVGFVNKTVLAVNEQVPQLQAQIDSTLSQVMPPLRSKADEIFGAVNDATEQLDAIPAPGSSSGDDSLLARSTRGVDAEETGKKHSNKMSLLEVRASRGKVAVSKARLEFAIARKGGSSGVCDTVQAKISAANGTVIGFSEMLSGVNTTFVDTLAAVTGVVETGLQAVLNATQEKMDASEDAGVDPTNKPLSILSSGSEKLQAALEKLPLTSDKDLGDAETSIVKAQASLASLSDSLDDMKSAADEACSLVSGEVPALPR